MKKELRSIILFCIGGGISVGIYYLVLYYLTEKIQVWYPISAIIGSVIMYSISFVFQKFLTFENKETEDLKKEIIKYFFMSSSFTLSNSILLYILVEFMHLGYFRAQLILTVILSVCSYFITKKILKK